MKNALVTGGAGFIGSHLVDRLLRSNWRVTVIDNFDPFYDPEIKRHNISQHLSHKNYRLIEGDIRDFEQVQQDLTETYDVIVHLAAKAGVRPSIESPIEYSDVNVKGTQYLLEFAVKRNITQFVFGSSSSVYGANPNTPWSESDSVLNPISPYASTKLSCELMGHVYSHLYKIRFIGLRFFTVYGPRQRPDLAIHKFSNMILNNKAIPFFGDGNTQRDYTYVDDIVTGICAAIHYDNTLYEIINLGNHATVSLKEMVGTLEDVFDTSAVLNVMPEQPGDVPQTFANITKAYDLLGYYPSTTFKEGIAKFKNWLVPNLITLG